MLRLSTKGQYGVRAMFEIARGYPSAPTTIKEISERQEVSPTFLEQILSTLRRAGLVASIKGPGGGYVLGRTPALVSIGAILNALEGPVAITSCLGPEDEGSSGGSCSRVEGCVTRLIWRSLGQKIQAFLDTITLDDLLREAATLGEKKEKMSVVNGVKSRASKRKKKGAVTPL